MDLQKVVKKSVRDSFAKVGSLASNVVLKNRDATFNFNTMVSTPVLGSTKTVKAIQLDSRKRPAKLENSNVISTTLMFIADDVLDLSTYDLIEYAGFTWNISHPANSNGYTATAEISREL
jgi:hypothetical protein